MLGPLYMILGDLEGALGSFAWFEAAFPVLGERLNDAATLSEAAAAMIDIAEEHLAGVPSNTDAVRATLRSLLARTARAHDPDY